MRILITGGSGYIGTYLARRWQDEHELLIFDLVEAEAPFDYIRGDLREFDQIHDACSNIDAIIHGGAIPYDNGVPREIIETNGMGTFNVLESAVAQGVGKVILISSMCATGIGPFSRVPVVPHHFPVDEAQECVPEDTYGLSKLLGEELCGCYSRRYDLSTICLRLGMVFDPDRPDAVGRLGKIMENPDYGSLYHWGCVDVRDMAQAFELALNASGITHGVYHLCGPEVAAREPTLELVGRYFTTVPVKEPQVYFENPYRGLIDTTRARRELGFQPQYPVRNSYFDPEGEEIP
jgi:UDP-glucose 4-epimerase